MSKCGDPKAIYIFYEMSRDCSVLFISASLLFFRLLLVPYAYIRVSLFAALSTAFAHFRPLSPASPLLAASLRRSALFWFASARFASLLTPPSPAPERSYSFMLDVISCPASRRLTSKCKIVDSIKKLHQSFVRTG